MNSTGRLSLLALLSRMRLHREPVSLLIDGTVIWLAWQATHLFRLGFDRWLGARAAYDGALILAIVTVYLVVFKAMRLTTSAWRHSGFVDIRRLAMACAMAGLVCGLLISPVLQLTKVSSAVLALHPIVSLMGLCLVRLLYRMLVEHLEIRGPGAAEPARPVLILGAGESAKRLVAGIQGRGWRVLGLLDDDPVKWGATVAGHPVLGPLEAVADLAPRLAATHLILALPSLRGSARRRVIDQASRSGLPLLTVPSADELREGTEAARLRDIDPSDLLGRDPVALDETGVRQEVTGQVVLVTGAGGSIGAELCVQLSRLQPAVLVLLDHSEYALYRIEQRLREQVPGLALHPVLGDVKARNFINALMIRYRPALVFHAAAYKHVPLVEQGNARAALLNNTMGTWHVAQSAALSGVRRVVLVSTDKAVNPTNVMGATKRAAERLLASLASDHPGTHFIAVRFGNVLGSSGSVIPRFQEQIARGGPITVTHPDIIRYFMTIHEACRLVLQAAAIGESGQVLVLDMGQPMKIVELARALVRLSGHREDDIPIVYTGLRPGEKLYEELLADEDTTLPTPVSAIRLARLSSATDRHAAQSWVQAVEAIAETAWGESEAAVRAHLRRLVPEFQPNDEAGSGLVSEPVADPVRDSR